MRSLCQSSHGSSLHRVVHLPLLGVHRHLARRHASGRELPLPGGAVCLRLAHAGALPDLLLLRLPQGGRRTGHRQPGRLPRLARGALRARQHQSLPRHHRRQARREPALLLRRVLGHAVAVGPLLAAPAAPLCRRHRYAHDAPGPVRRRVHGQQARVGPGAGRSGGLRQVRAAKH